MSLTVSTPAENNYLTSIEAIKTELSIDFDDLSSDKLIWDLIRQASDYIETFCGRTFAKETVVETLGVKDPYTLKVVLDRTPVLSISSVGLSGSTVGSSTFEIEDAEAGILFRETSWTPTTIWGNEITARRLDGRRDWSFTYEAGYVLPTWASTAGNRTLPRDLERACIDIVKSWYLSAEDNPQIQRQRTGEASESRFNTATGFSPVTTNTMEKWRRLV